MKIPTICRYCGGKIIKSTTRALYPKGSEPIYLCVNCNAYVGCYPDGSPMGKVANTVLRLKRQETHRIFDRFWREQGWTTSAGASTGTMKISMWKSTTSSKTLNFSVWNWSTLPWIQGSLSVYAESAGAVCAEAVCAAAQPCPLKKRPED